MTLNNNRSGNKLKNRQYLAAVKTIGMSAALQCQQIATPPTSKNGFHR
jgi:hypothetical protein